MPDVEPTLGEVFRGIAAVREDIARLIGRDEYNAHREGTEHRFRDITSDLQTLASTVERLAQRVDERFQKIEDTRRNQSLQTRVALISSLLGPVVVLLFSTFVNSQVGP